MLLLSQTSFQHVCLSHLIVCTMPNWCYIHTAKSVAVTVGVAVTTAVFAIISVLISILCVIYFLLRIHHHKRAALGNVWCYNVPPCMHVYCIITVWCAFTVPIETFHWSTEETEDRFCCVAVTVHKLADSLLNFVSWSFFRYVEWEDLIIKQPVSKTLKELNYTYTHFESWLLLHISAYLKAHKNFTTDCNRRICLYTRLYGIAILITMNFLGIYGIFRASLSKPHIDHDNGPHTRNNGIYLSFTPRLSHPGSRDSCNALKCSVYSGILMCSHAWFTEQQGWFSAMKIIDEDR